MLGRILNSVSRGYAVGLGGIVAFLPMSQCLVRTAQRIGVLQPFRVSQVKREVGAGGRLQPNVVVIDAEKLREVSTLRTFLRGAPSFAAGLTANNIMIISAQSVAMCGFL